MTIVEINVPEAPKNIYNTNPLEIPCCKVVELELNNTSGKYYGILADGTDNSLSKYINVVGENHSTIMHTRLSDIRKWRLAPAGITIKITT